MILGLMLRRKKKFKTFSVLLIASVLLLVSGILLLF